MIKEEDEDIQSSVNDTNQKGPIQSGTGAIKIHDDPYTAPIQVSHQFRLPATSDTLDGSESKD
jgi:hypothetical protein